MALEYSFGLMDSLGIIELLIFMLIFVVVFAILQKAKIFGDPHDEKTKKVKTYNAVIALVMGALVIFPHVLYGDPSHQATRLSNGYPDVVNIIAQALPNVSVVVVAILMALLIIGILGRRFEIGDTPLSGWIAVGAFAVIIYIFGSAAGWWDYPIWLDILNNPDIMALVVVVLVFAIVIHFITKEDKPKDPEKSFAGQFGKMLQKP